MTEREIAEMCNAILDGIGIGANPEAQERARVGVHLAASNLRALLKLNEAAEARVAYALEIGQIYLDGQTRAIEDLWRLRHMTGRGS